MANRFKNTFQVVCFLLAIYMSVLLVGRFLEDRSTTSIMYRHYNEKPQDRYPTYSICFRGTKFHWQNDLEIFDEYGLNPYQFEQLLKGETTFSYEYDHTSRLYKKVPSIIRNVQPFDLYHVQNYQRKIPFFYFQY